jgi:23S rRNA pseudouridine1911/1915/1917 synthase
MPEASGRTLKQLLERGRVYVDGSPVKRGDVEVGESAAIRVAPKDPPPEPVPDSALKIVHEDDALLIVDKPPGLLTVSERDEGRPSAWSQLRAWLVLRGDDVEPFLVHRLDAPASGLLVFAKSELVKRAMKDLFASHAIDRHYAAIVEGDLRKDEGAFESDLVEFSTPPYRVRSVRPSDPPEARETARTSLTRWRRISSRGHVHAVETRLETGRKHQIRVHWSEAGCPIVGDELYGGRKAKRLYLHAWSLGFVHPTTRKPLRCVARPGGSFDAGGSGAFAGEPQLRSLDPAAGRAGTE